MWNDGISKEMNDLFESIVPLGEETMEIAKQVIDSEVKDFTGNVDRRIPVYTGGLKKSFTIKKVEGEKDYYGYSASFKGKTPFGVEYEKLANILNYGVKNGDHTFAGTFFVSRAVKKLKGMDARIEARIEAHLRKRT